MIRALAEFAPVLLPILIYTLLVLAARYGLVPGIVRLTRADQGFSSSAPWGWLIAATVATLLVCVFALATSHGEKPGGVYAPAHMEGGKLVPGEIRRP
jgi:amino acid transporter